MKKYNNLIKNQNNKISSLLVSLKLYILREPFLSFGIFILFLITLISIFPDYFASFDPRETNASTSFKGPSITHWFGTDTLGRDIYSRVIYGTGTSLTVASISVGISLVIGSFLGLISGYYGGIIDQILGRLMDIIFSLPALLLAIVISGILGPSLKNAVMAIAIVYTPHFFRVARSGTIAISARPFVLSSKIIGAKDFRILVEHIFPNISALLIVQTTVSFAYAILLEASLSFLGLGVQPPNPSLGSILNDGRPFLQLTPWMSIFPGIVIFLSVLVINLIGDTLRDRFDISQGIR